MYKSPSRRKFRKSFTKPNITPILDVVFIFIFFLLMSANFVKLFEVSSNIPIVSESDPPKSDKPPLSLTLIINKNSLVLKSGYPLRTLRVFKRDAENKYNFENLHNYLIKIKSKNLNEKTIIFEPRFDIEYESLIKIMDTVRVFRPTDQTFYRKLKNGTDVKIKELFDDIIFGNIQS